jgi:hypothetical protein
MIDPLEIEDEQPLQEKRCGKCKRIKAVDNFNKNKSTKSGYSCHCKQCKKDGYLKRTEGLFAKRIFDQSTLLSQGLKRCSNCETTKPLDEFNKDNKNKKDGRFSWCRNCTSKINTAWRREQGQKEKSFKRTEEDKILLEHNLKRCVDCNNTLPLDDFYAATRGWGGVAASCKGCNLEKCKTVYRENLTKNAREWKRDNAKWKEQHRLQQAKRKGWIKESGSDLSKEFIEGIYSTENCYYCNEFIEPEK